MDVRFWIAAAATALAACASAPEGAAPDAAAKTAASVAARADVTPRAPIDGALIARFAPSPTSTQEVDYALIDEALDLMVFNAGPSLRQRQGRAQRQTGTRFARGHESPYRLEGNKVFFSQFDYQVREAIAEYRQSLEAIGASGKVTSLPRNEQLAYWYNLHNFVVIDEIADQYPTKRPRELSGPDGRPFHDAKVVDLGDAQLSLREVREVVYTHWSDPKVMYGFYLGDIGGPSIRDRAYTGQDVSEALGRQAREFVNSLRGVSRGGGNVYVSAFYDEGRAHFFEDWPSDLRAHLARYADDEVAELLADDRPLAFAPYELAIADMAGGEVTSSLQAVEGAVRPGVPESVTRMAVEYRQKLLQMRQEGQLKGTVVIVDVDTEDEDDTIE